jgi:hypothetical protein
MPVLSCKVTLTEVAPPDANEVTPILSVPAVKPAPVPLPIETVVPEPDPVPVPVVVPVPSPSPVNAFSPHPAMVPIKNNIPVSLNKVFIRFSCLRIRVSLLGNFFKLLYLLVLQICHFWTMMVNEVNHRYAVCRPKVCTSPLIISSTYTPSGDKSATLFESMRLLYQKCLRIELWYLTISTIFYRT